KSSWTCSSPRPPAPRRALSLISATADSGQRVIEPAGDEEPDEPGVVVERLQRLEDEPAPRERAAGERRDRRRPAPSARVAVASVHEVEVLEPEGLPPEEPVV